MIRKAVILILTGKGRRALEEKEIPIIELAKLVKELTNCILFKLIGNCLEDILLLRVTLN